uniref:Uncharacterized protein n=1 Tax=Physcomitrium patens TaxID=3218 RepID=A0A2K1IF17_PHYPA|nr:hypothetical protein PHYPA_028457 [Physcomitrium patens]
MSVSTKFHWFEYFKSSTYLQQSCSLLQNENVQFLDIPSQRCPYDQFHAEVRSANGLRNKCVIDVDHAQPPRSIHCGNSGHKMWQPLPVALSGTLAAKCGGSSTPGQPLHRHKSLSLSGIVLYTPRTCNPHPAHDVLPQWLHSTE